MESRSLEDLRDELHRLMAEQIESLKREAFIGRQETEVKKQEERLKRIREISADYLAAIKNNHSPEPE